MSGQGYDFPPGSGGGGSGIDQLTGNVTAGPGSGSQVATIANDAVTYAKMQNISAASRLLGRGSAGGAGDPEEITLGANLTMTGTSLAATGATIPTGTGFTHITAGAQDAASKLVDTADVNNDQITYAKMQNVSAADRLLGRGNGGGSGDPQEISLGTNLSLSGTTLNASGGGGVAAPDVQIFTTTGANTWNKPSAGTPTFVEVLLMSGGGGGGSGRVHTGVLRTGGDGGAGGSLTHRLIPASQCGASETVTVGAGGAGGAANTTDSTNGNPGSQGGTTSFGSLLQATGGAPGTGGSGTVTTSAPVPGFGTEGLGASGAIAGNGSLPGASGNPSTSTGAGAGAAGGSLAAAPTARNGGTGGAGSLIYPGFSLGGSAGTGGAAPGAGTDLTTTTFGELLGGPGGGGSASKTGANTDAGAAGGRWGGGGGGSGATENGFDTGAGGAGGQGFAVVITYYRS